MVITSECISLAFEGKEDEVDRIPLDQVEFIKEFVDHLEDASDSLEELTTVDNSSWHIMQIATIPGGFNGGRSYYLRSNSKYILEKLINLVSELSAQAKKRADKSSFFWRLQKRVAIYYTHDAFQAVVSLLIAGVSYCICTAFSAEDSAKVSITELCLHNHRVAKQQQPGGRKRGRDCVRTPDEYLGLDLHNYFFRRARHKLILPHSCSVHHQSLELARRHHRQRVHCRRSNCSAHRHRPHPPRPPRHPPLRPRRLPPPHCLCPHLRNPARLQHLPHLFPTPRHRCLAFRARRQRTVE